MGRKNFTEDDCIESIKRASESVDGRLSQTDYERMGISPSLYVIKDRCGSWNKAKEKAGLEINEISKIDKPPEIINVSQKEWKNMSRNQRYLRRNRAKAAEVKIDSGCKECGYDSNPAALVFHHPDDNKKDDVSNMISRGAAKEKIMSEIRKCSVVCSNCHKVMESGNCYEID